MSNCWVSVLVSSFGGWGELLCGWMEHACTPELQCYHLCHSLYTKKDFTILYVTLYVTIVARQRWVPLRPSSEHYHLLFSILKNLTLNRKYQRANEKFPERFTRPSTQCMGFWSQSQHCPAEPLGNPGSTPSSLGPVRMGLNVDQWPH